MILQKLRRGEHVDHFETVRIRKDGQRIDISVTISPIRDSTGQIIGASKIARDITDLKRSTRERERLYELSKAMAAQSDPHALVQLITDAATELSRAEFGAFFYNTTTDQGEAYMLYTISGVPRENFDKFPMPRNTAVFKVTFDGTGIVRSDDITKDPRYGHNEPHHGMPKGTCPCAATSPSRSWPARAKSWAGCSSAIPRPVFSTSRLKKSSLPSPHRAPLPWKTPGFTASSNSTRRSFANFQTASPNSPGWRGPMAPSPGTTTAGTNTPAPHPSNRKGGAGNRFTIRKSFLASSKSGKLPWPPAQAGKILFRCAATTAFFAGISPAPSLSTTMPEISSSGSAPTPTSPSTWSSPATAKTFWPPSAPPSEAERVSRMKDEFLATLSHELRTPLNAILGWSQLLTHRAPDAKMFNEGITVIERNARAQTQLIEDLLDMSRIVSGRIRLDVQRVDLTNVVESAIESIKPSADAKDIRIRKLLDPLASGVAGDPNRLQQVVWNLLSNAVKFTPKGGRIEILLERVNSHVELTVTDTGQGIEPDFLPHVFGRFRQADSSTSRKHGGLGLGLAIVKQLIELHGGTVRAKAPATAKAPPLPSLFPSLSSKTKIQNANIPLPHPWRKPSTTTPSPSRASKSSLLMMRKMPASSIKRFLTARQANVQTAKSAIDGLDQLKKEKPDILISDIGMPNKDGYQFIRDVRSLPPDQGGKTPAVALTAFARSEDRTRAMMAGYQIHISKPVEPHELIATVASLAGLSTPTT